MKKIHKIFLLGTLLFGAASAAAVLNTPKDTQVVEAAHTTNFPRSGTSGTVLYVTGYGSFFGSEAKLAICCWNNSGSAWSDAVDYCCYNNIMRVMIPYKDGQSQTWSYYKVCRYNPNMNPKESGDYGVYNSTNDISFGSMLYGHNTVLIKGYDSNSKLNYDFGNNDYYGIQGGNRVYLDLSSFTGWEESGAKFALWFGAPHYSDESRWGQANSVGGYYSSFCWKVNGQDNDHLYECFVPSLNPSNSTIWNLVIAVRINPIASEPTWDCVWNKSQDLHFNPDNENATMLRITDWNTGELDTVNSISKESRLDFFSRYFLNTVKCSGSGNSDATTDEMWNALKYEYQTHLITDYQGDVWLTEADPEGTLLQQAMARYDYIVLYKQYAHEDFINRAESPSVSTSNYLAKNEDFDYMTNVLVVIIAVSLASVILITLFKVKHRKQ